MMSKLIQICSFLFLAFTIQGQERNQEELNGEKMISSLEQKDWKNFGKYYQLYYETAYSNSKYHINNMSWKVFLNVSDDEVLQVAVKTMKYNIDHFDYNNANAYDTYANLLHKSGRTLEGIKWEEKAVQMDPGSKWKRQALEKMRRREKTW